jgi:16S rRNA (adenine1518-N6/adenine1519-N6)-dimethyltransferase
LSPARPDRAPSARALLERHGLRAKKSWGQNFLVDGGVLARIAAAATLEPDDVVVEIGAGLGALTRELAPQARQVLAIERDAQLVPILREQMAPWPHVAVVPIDALDFDFRAAAAAAGRPLVVVGNLPYQITSPILFALIDVGGRGQVVSREVLMVQREFAERTAAGPGSKTYGRLSVMVQQQASVEMLFHVGAGAFHPRPEVSSTVLRLSPRPTPLDPVRDEKLFADVVRAAFATRRKMLRNALAAVFGEEGTATALARAAVDGTRRAEELTVTEFAQLADAFLDVTRA